MEKCHVGQKSFYRIWSNCCNILRSSFTLLAVAPYHTQTGAGTTLVRVSSTLTRHLVHTYENGAGANHQTPAVYHGF